MARFSVLSLFLVPVLLGAQPQNVQDAPRATVVFFTPGGHWRGMGERLNPFAGKAKMVSNGTVFEASEAVVKMSHSRFVVLKVAPGGHTFSVSRMDRHSSAKGEINVTLQPGTVTYFAVTTTTPSVLAGIAAAETSHLTPSTCTEFATRAKEDHSEPVEMSQVADKYRPMLDEHFDPAVCAP